MLIVVNFGIKSEFKIVGDHFKSIYGDLDVSLNGLEPGLIVMHEWCRFFNQIFLFGLN